MEIYLRYLMITPNRHEVPNCLELSGGRTPAKHLITLGSHYTLDHSPFQISRYVNIVCYTKRRACRAASIPVSAGNGMPDIGPKLPTYYIPTWCSSSALLSSSALSGISLFRRARRAGPRKGMYFLQQDVRTPLRYIQRTHVIADERLLKTSGVRCCS
jgi:hypothetical protein